MRTVDRNAVQTDAARQQRVPHLFESWDGTAAKIVDHGMAVEDLEQFVVPDLAQLVGRDRPPEIRVVDVRNALRVPDRIDVALQHVDNRSAALRVDLPGDVEAVDVQWLAAEP